MTLVDVSREDFFPPTTIPTRARRNGTTLVYGVLVVVTTLVVLMKMSLSFFFLLFSLEKDMIFAARLGSCTHYLRHKVIWIDT